VPVAAVAIVFGERHERAPSGNQLVDHSVTAAIKCHCRAALRRSSSFTRVAMLSTSWFGNSCGTTEGPGAGEVPRDTDRQTNALNRPA
jgi:hypothetical protein